MGRYGRVGQGRKGLLAVPRYQACSAQMLAGKASESLVMAGLCALHALA